MSQLRTRIELGTSGTIDLTEDIPMPLTFSIADIKNPDVRQGAYSKTITIPGSKANDKLFSFIFEIDGDCNFNPNLKTPCIVYIDGLEQINGFLRLMKIISIDDNQKSYECSIIGNVSNIFTTLGDAELTDLNLSAYDHTYNKATQKASWSAPVGSGYVYPMIDYGQTNTLTYDVTNFFPALYVKTYVDKIFEYAGFSYTSNFFDSTTFKSLIVPFNSNTLKLSESDIDSRLFIGTIASSGTVSLSSLAAGTYTNPYTTPVPYNSETSDVSNQFNTTTYTFTAQKTGSYNLLSSFDYQLNSTFAYAPSGWVVMIKYSGGIYTTLSSIPFATYGGIDTTLRTAAIVASGVELLAGDQVFIGLQIVAGALGTPNLNIGITTATSGFFYNQVNNTGLFEGNNVSMTLAVPPKIKMKEFLMWVVKMFNLYIETDKDTSFKLNIEPRNDFYSSGTTIDWTDKLDVSQPLEMEPMGELDARKYVFTYTDDKDYYNELYLKTWNDTYGYKLLDVTNEFMTGTKEVKVGFSPTPIVNNGATDRILPTIYSVDSTGNITPKQSNIRILYYGGTKTTAYPWTYTGELSGTSTETTYPYAGHLDDPASPTIDLSFGVPHEVYYAATTYTNNNLYNAYYSQFINEITDKDSKIISGWFFLNPVDILTLDFRNQFYVDGHMLRLIKISDYNPVQATLTRCEFIKIKTGNAFVPEVKSLNGGLTHLFGTAENVPDTSGTGSPKLTYIGGMRTPGNYVDPSSDGVIVTGTRNHIGAGCSNVSLLNSSGCAVMGGLHGVTLINTSGVTITQSDITYIEGERVYPSAFNKPCAMLSDSTTQTIASANAGQVITFDTNEHLNGITHSTSSNTSRVYINTSGTYVISYEAHATSTSANQNMYFWLRIDGVDVDRSTTDISIVNANDSKSVTLVYIHPFSVGQYFEVVVGATSTNCSIPAFAAVVAPSFPVRPAGPSNILTVEMV